MPLPSPTYDEQFEIISIGLVNLGAKKRDQVVIQIFVCLQYIPRYGITGS